MRRVVFAFSFLLASVWSTQSFSQTEAELAAVQNQLNKEVMEKPFSVEAEEKISAYIQDAMQRDLKPEATKAPDYWKPGYTCADIYNYGWQAYRNCRYYRHYYGYYW